MKKIWIVLSVILSLVLVAGIVIFAIKLNSTDTVYAKIFESRYNELKMYVGDTFKLNNSEFLIEPANCTEKVFYISTNTEIVSVDASSGELQAKAVGTCFVKAYIKCSETENLETEIKIIVQNKSDVQDRTIVNQSKTCLLSQGITYIEFVTNGDRSAVTYEVISGSEHVDTENIYLENDKIIVALTSVGTTTLKINCPDKIIMVTTIKHFHCRYFFISTYS